MTVAVAVTVAVAGTVTVAVADDRSGAVAGANLRTVPLTGVILDRDR